MPTYDPKHQRDILVKFKDYQLFIEFWQDFFVN
jgi:hypothetical protein